MKADVEFDPPILNVFEAEMRKPLQIEVRLPQEMQEDKVGRHRIGNPPASDVDGATLKDEKSPARPDDAPSAFKQPFGVCVGPIMQDGFERYQISGSRQG